MAFFVVRKKVHWSDGDAAGIAWFPNYFGWFEDVEEELFAAALGQSRQSLLDGERFGMPRVEAHIRYEAPVRIGTLLAHRHRHHPGEPAASAPRLRDDPRRRRRCASRMASCASPASISSTSCPSICPRSWCSSSTASRRWPSPRPKAATRCPGRDGPQASCQTASRIPSRCPEESRAPSPAPRAPRAPQRVARLGRLRAVLRLGERPHPRPARRAVLAADDRRRPWPGAGVGLRDRPGDDAARPRRRARRRRRSVGRDAGAGPPAGAPAAARRPARPGARRHPPPARSPIGRSRW